MPRSSKTLICLTAVCIFLVLFSFVFLRDNRMSPGLPPLEELKMAVATKNHAETKPTLFFLDNGMKIVLKKNKTDEEDILIQLLAKKGYASLPKEQIPSARIASEVLWEAGFGPYDNAALSTFLYEHQSELSFDEQPFYRVINATTDAVHLEAILGLIVDLFDNPHVDTTSLQIGQNEVARLQPPLSSNPEKMFDNAVRQFNTSNYYDFENAHPIMKEELNLEVVRHFIREAYAHPEEFVLVIVGEFEEIVARKTLERTIGSIPREPTRPRLPDPYFPPFPSGNPQKKVVSKQRSNCVTRLTFPIQMAINEQEIRNLEFLTLLLSHHFRDFLLEEELKTFGLTVAYEFPFFPFLNATWMTFQFQTETARDGQILFEKIQKELVRLDKEGFSPKDLASAKKQTLSQEEYWMSENSYWLNRLTNIAIWNWPLSILDAPPIDMTLQEAHTTLRRYINPNVFSRFSLNNQ